MTTDITSNLFIEQCVLSILLNHNDSYDSVSHILQFNDFSSSIHQLIFNVMQKKLMQGYNIDTISMTHELAKKQPDNVENTMQPIKQINLSPTYLISYVKILRDIYLRRKLKYLIDEVNNDIKKEDNALSCWSKIEEASAHIYDTQSTNNVLSFGSVTRDIYTKSKRLMEGEKIPNRIMTGFSSLDNIIGGLRPGQMIVLAGRPSVGKTAFALNIANNCSNTMSDKKLGSLVISLEMPPEQIAARLVSSLTSIPLSFFTHGSIKSQDLQHLQNTLDDLDNIPIYIYDSFELKIPQLRSLLRQYVRKNNIKLVIIDYLQLIESMSRNSSREQQISEMSRSIKLLAKEVNLPIIVLSQMSRDIEKRGESKPRLSDLRGSGAIEQDADVVIFLHRDKNDNTSDTAICSIAKNRNGALGDVNLQFKGNICTFFDNNNEDFTFVPYES